MSRPQDEGLSDRPPIDPRRVDRATRISAITLRVVAFALAGMGVAAGVRQAPAWVDLRWVWANAIAFALAPAIALLLLAFPIARRQFWAVVVSLTLTSSVLLLALIAATFVAARIVSDNFTSFAWFYVVMLGALSLPYGIALYPLMRTFDAMRPDDWTQ